MTMDAQSACSPSQIKAAEEAAMMILQNELTYFVAFPTQSNAKRVAERMEAYQTAWMNGRQRP